MSDGTVYLIHFSEPLGDLSNPRGQARHYLGWASDLDARLAAHRAGNGARLMQVVNDAGIDWTLARTWAGGRDLERRLKRQKNAPRLCTRYRLKLPEMADLGKNGKVRQERLL